MTDSSRPIEHQHPSLPFVQTFEVDHDNADENEGWRAWLDALVATIAVVSGVVAIGLASYHWHAQPPVPQCLATSYDDCE